MAKKKKFKLSKKQRKQVLALGIPVLAGIAGLIIGISAITLISYQLKPSNLVWAADKTVSVPKGLKTFLENKDNCNEYRGKGTPDGIGLWGVYQTSKGQFAKIAYGCSWNLDSYIMAVKYKGSWQLLPPIGYFAPFKDGVDPAKGALPLCEVIKKYGIPKDIESFCIASDGSAKLNDI